MKKQVFNYISLHPGCTHRDCAAALNIKDFDALIQINSLKNDGLLAARIQPLGNSKDPDCSHFYFARGEYPKEEQ